MKPSSALVGLLLLLGVSLAGAPAPSAKTVPQLIAELDHEKFGVREQAQRELARRGEEVVPALRQALKNPASLEQARRLQRLLALYRPTVYDAHADGWHWVYSTIAHAQALEATGARVKGLRLRVAQLSGTRPAAPLEVEIRGPELRTIYVRGTIDPDRLQREFRWQPVALKHVAPLRPKENYVLLFH